MPIDRVVVNASPLISLFRAGLEDLLPKLFSEIIVPGEVWDEVTSAGKDDKASVGIVEAEWIKCVRIDYVDPIVLGWSLGVGETSVLSYARNHTVDRVVLDDAAARRCAITLNLKILGTGGLLILAKKRGLITSVKDTIESLQDAGLWIGDGLKRLLLHQAEE